MEDQQVCAVHGGRIKNVRAHVARGKTERKIRFIDGQLPVTPIENPLERLQYLAGEVWKWKELLAEFVAKIVEEDQLRYGTDGGDAIRGEVILFTDAIKDCHNVLVSIAKLNIDERLTRIAEQQRDMILAAIEAGLAKVGVTGPRAIEARVEVANRLRVVPDLPPLPPRIIPAA